MEAMERLKNLAISDSGFLFDPLSGATFTINEPGREILEQLKQGCGRKEIIEHLQRTFEVQLQDLHRDLDEFVHLLRQSDLLPPNFQL